jgi:hypothetical protein
MVGWVQVGVEKVHPRNGHRYIAKKSIQILKFTVCEEFLGRNGFQCTTCNSTIRPKCFSKVVTKCSTENTG